MLATENKFGPSKNLPLQNAVRIRIPEKKKLSVLFDSNALRENVLIIYEGIIAASGSSMTFRELATPVEKGNYPAKTGRNLLQVFINNPSMTASMYVFFSGWHKESEPNNALPWKVSNVCHSHYSNTGILVDDSIARWGKIAFEDTPWIDNDFNDIVAIYTHID